mgnify:FL=1
MVTYFNRKDLVKFGEYLLSEERRELYKQNPNFPNELLLEERLSEVSHSDIENFIENQRKDK